MGVEDKRSRVDEPHVGALNDLARSLRVRDGGVERFVPWFDPDSGGVAAQDLVLMETPGPRTVAVGDLGFSSEDNADPTAAALREARAGAGLARTAYLRCNVVPWPLVDIAGHRRPPLVADLDDARPALQELLSLLPDLELVVAVGAPRSRGSCGCSPQDRRVCPASPGSSGCRTRPRATRGGARRRGRG
ncbi:Insertion element IS1415 transposase [Serinicoccus hydrothermalis]|uniref:Insertion element IS1415 transposase n=1 Tax=Serinicoccus hydrothermalis TaxID=1758689 RepID=A0A1B1NDW6_9MICO|nr:Insertion element IS1415 transposase [Serinicoccus hydrothermalis]